MYMILFVLNNPDQLNDLLNAWDETGVGGVTILPSAGLGHILKNYGLRDDLPLFPSLGNLMEHEEMLNRTLFTLVENDEMVDRIVQATQKITGDLDQPNTGIMAVLPIARAYGIKRRNGDQR